RRLSELKDQVLQIRMVPVSQIYAKLGQALRRASRALEKDVLLEVFGEDTEIDKFLAEEVLDPLVHIVRNALDHGIETEKDRTALGKTRRGTIKIRSFQQGNNVVIEVSDDGRGINPEEVETKARDRGLIRKNQQLSTEDIFELLFRPGFSTSESVSEISGRGVGLDVVKEKLSALGGLVELKSRKGLGTTVILTLPITLAIVKAMIVRAGKDRFAVPLSSMSETLIMEKEKIREVEKTRYYDLRGEILPLKGLHELLGLRDNPADRPFAVVAGMGEKKIGLLVDELAGQQEIVIKPIGEYFEGVRYFAGAAEISRQEIILVLDIEAIVTDVLNQTRGAANV
ncbi:MAG: chemotaxis protein CheA, partial [Desulfobacterales bacterium]|nr:chemotaxis protein CheA [Desulfobacterales bacterium]